MNCIQCPVQCGADRSINNGACSSKGLKIAKYYLHPFEEPPISFSKGSGCVFFCGCSLKCVFCQNYDVSRSYRGKEINIRELAEIFKSLEQSGADNINLVNPTHFVSDIYQAFEIYRPNIPVVYNTHGYERLETLRVAEKFTDIWLPDLKFISRTAAARYTARADYPDYALPAISFMAQKQPSFTAEGKMLTGCIVRHLILPQNIAEAVGAVNFFASLPAGAYLSIMSQYTPFGEIENFPELKRKITRREYNAVVQAARAANLNNVFVQDYDSADTKFIPQWDF